MSKYDAIADYSYVESKEKEYSDDFFESEVYSKSFSVNAKNAKNANDIAFNTFLDIINKEGLLVNKNSIYIWEITEDDRK